jgi:DNA-binding transcriptional regulator GbsR (MarR family)
MYEFSDKLGRFFEKNGLPRMAGRVMGHLLAATPPEQTFDEIVAAVGASRSSVSVATQLLLRLQFIERFSVPEERRDRYRLAADAWTVILRQDLEAARELRALAERAIQSAKAERVPLGQLEQMRDFYGFLEESLEPLLAKWERRRRSPSPPRRSS